MGSAAVEGKPCGSIFPGVTATFSGVTDGFSDCAMAALCLEKAASARAAIAAAAAAPREMSSAASSSVPTAALVRARTSSASISCAGSLDPPGTTDDASIFSVASWVASATAAPVALPSTLTGSGDDNPSHIPLRLLNLELELAVPGVVAAAAAAAALLLGPGVVAGVFAADALGVVTGKEGALNNFVREVEDPPESSVVWSVSSLLPCRSIRCTRLATTPSGDRMLLLLLFFFLLSATIASPSSSIFILLKY
mmetsp:Transcript_20681/g.44715  ORF Transcript_20681/g.44715 Transcript_20681/m.44715 type:complete len:253 (-) Transcript_20681:179-937(-)